MIDTYKTLKQYTKLSQTAERLRVLHQNITTASFSELLSEHDTVVKCLEVYEEFRFTTEASVLYEKYIMLFKQYMLRKRPELSCTNKIPDITLLYIALEQMYDIEKYAAVIEIGSLILDAMNRNPEEVVPFILLFKLLVGKAKFHSMNYSDGINDIEFVLNGITHAKSEELRNDFKKYKEEACWYLIPRLVYINNCYNVTTIVYGGLFHLMFTPVIYLMWNHISITMHALCDYLHIEASRKLIHYELEEPSFLVMYTLVDSWQSKLFSSITNMEVFHFAGKVAYQLMLFTPMIACIALDALLVWARLILPYIIYLYFRQHRVFKEFLADILQILDFSFIMMTIVLVGVLSCRHIQELSQSLLLVIRTVRDPRWKYGADQSLHVRFLIDQ